MRTKRMMFTLGCITLWATTAAVAWEMHEHAMKVGKKGEITLKESAKVNVTYTEPDATGEIKCRMEPATAHIKETSVSIAHEKSGGDRITQVVIKGEDVVHIF